MLTRLKLVFFILLSASLRLSAQDTIPDREVEQRLENIAENLEAEDIDYTTLLDALDDYKRHPLNLNTATREELGNLILLNEVQINNLLQHIEHNGKLITMEELQSIDGFDLATIRRILPYVRIAGTMTDAHFSLNEMLKHGRHQWITRYQQIIEEQAGFLPASDSLLKANPNARYLGSPHKLYTRYRFNYGTYVSWGFTAEKDAGEEFFRGTQPKGFDFYSAHLFVRNIRFVRALAIGDYQVNFGQGLTAWSGLAFGKSADAINIKRNAQGLRPYTSVDENLFMRGAAATVGFKKFEFTGFFSHKKIDANVSEQDTLTDETLAVSALQETGYHTTAAELADKHAIDQTVIGGNASYKSRNFTAGLTGIRTEYGVALERSLQLHNQFEFSAKSNTTIGADYSYVFRNFNFFGEVSVSENGGYAYLNGLLISVDPRLSFTALHRNYQRNFQSLTSNAFGEGARPSNEKGIYTGVVARPFSTITVTAYYDRFVFPWLTYQADAPSYGTDYLAQVNYTPTKKLDMYFRIRQRDKFKNTTEDIDGLDFIVPVRQTNYRFNISYPGSPSVKLRNRIEYITYDTEKAPEHGYAIYQDVSWKPLGFPVSATFRYALFHTDSYNARIYAFETDVPGAYSVPAYYFRGSRVYVVASWDINRHFELWARWAQTYYNNKNIISEGSLSEINGNSKSEVKVQLRVKF